MNDQQQQQQTNRQPENNQQHQSNSFPNYGSYGQTPLGNYSYGNSQYTQNYNPNVLHYLSQMMSQQLPPIGSHFPPNVGHILPNFSRFSSDFIRSKSIGLECPPNDVHATFPQNPLIASQNSLAEHSGSNRQQFDDSLVTERPQDTSALGQPSIGSVLNETFSNEESLEDTSQSSGSSNVIPLSNSSNFDDSYDGLANNRTEEEELLSVVNSVTNGTWKAGKNEVTPRATMPPWLVMDPFVEMKWNFEVSHFDLVVYAESLAGWFKSDAVETADWDKFSDKITQLVKKYRDQLAKYFLKGLNQSDRRDLCGAIAHEYPKMGQRYSELRKSKAKGNNFGCDTTFTFRNITALLFDRLTRQIGYIPKKELETRPPVTPPVKNQKKSEATSKANRKRKQIRLELQQAEK